MQLYLLTFEAKNGIMKCYCKIAPVSQTTERSKKEGGIKPSLIKILIHLQNILLDTGLT